MSQSNLFPKVGAFLPSLPLGLIKRLRQVVEAGSPADTFACYCNLVEWLANYLANLCNSVYKDCPADQVDERLESTLRGLSQPLSFGTTVHGLQALSRTNYGLATKMPELSIVVSANRLPATCVRQIKIFKVIKKAREDFSIPPTHLRKFVRAQVPDDDQGTRATLDDYLRALIEFRNKGVGHQDEEGWFPRDRQMYSLLNEALAPSIDDLLDWEPMQALLTRYEVVSIERADSWPVGPQRACAVVRHHVADGYAPLGSSYLLLTPSLRVEAGFDVVARRGELPQELQSIVRFAAFPQTHQTSEQLHRRYAAVYLKSYLERGLVTPAQRENELGPSLRKLGIADIDRTRIEGEINAAINAFAPGDADRHDGPLQALAGQIGPEWATFQANAQTLLGQLPTRRKDYLLELVDNNTIMSFDQLRRESELSEPDLASVLEELEQEGRVRRIGAGASDRAHAHFKAQDPSKPGTFRGILAELHRHAPKRRYPVAFWRLIDLCSALLADDGFTIPESELSALRPLFEAGTVAAPPEPAPTGTITLMIGDEVLHAESVRDLYECAMDLLARRKVDPRPAVPFLIGRTRYLVNSAPEHANGTAFAVPVALGDLYFEANRTRDQAIAEVLRFLRRLGIDAASTDLPGAAPIDRIDDEDEDIGTEDDAASRLGVELRGADHEPPTTIRGATVRRFFAALLDHLLSRGADLERIIPVKAGRIRYLLSDEPYHANGSPFDAKSTIERDGYFMNTAFSYDQAILQARALCEQLGLQARALDGSLIEESETTVPLHIDIDGDPVEADDVPAFLLAAIEVLYSKGILTEADIPYKSGRVRYLLSEIPTHDHGRDFIRPIEVYLDDHRYFIEANVSRPGAVELIQRLLASKRPSTSPPVPPADT